MPSDWETDSEDEREREREREREEHMQRDMRGHNRVRRPTTAEGGTNARRTRGNSRRNGDNTQPTEADDTSASQAPRFTTSDAWQTSINSAMTVGYMSVFGGVLGTTANSAMNGDTSVGKYALAAGQLAVAAYGASITYPNANKGWQKWIRSGDDDDAGASAGKRGGEEQTREKKKEGNVQGKRSTNRKKHGGKKDDGKHGRGGGRRDDRHGRRKDGGAAA